MARRTVTLEQRQAYEDFRDWCIDEMAPRLKKEVRLKIRSISQEHSIEPKALIAMLYTGTPGETRPQLMSFMYDIFFN